MKTKCNQIFYTLVALAITLVSGVAHANGCAPGAVVITQAALPYTISSSNINYCLLSDLSFLGGSGQPAITINPGVNNIVINFNGHALTLASGQEVGIQMMGITSANVSNIVIKNGTIQSPANLSTFNNDAVNLTSAGSPNAAFKNVSFQNMNFLNTYNGLYAFNASDSAVNLQVSNSTFNNMPNSAINFMKMQGLSVVSSSFSNMPSVTINGEDATNVLIQNDVFNNNLQGIELDSGGDQSSGNVVITGTSFQSGSYGTFQDIKTTGMSNVKITYDSFNDFSTPNFSVLAAVTFTSENNATATPAASGLLIDHDTFTSTSTSLVPFTPYLGERMIQIGLEFQKFSGEPLVGASNVTVTNSTFTQTNANLIQGFPAGGSLPRGSAGIATNLFVFGVDGLYVANNTFTMNSTARLPDCSSGFPYPSSEYWIVGPPTPEPATANIQLGTSYGDINVKNVTILNNKINGPDQVGIFSETGALATPNSNITIIGNNITGTEQGILFDNTVSSLIAGNLISSVNGSSCFANGTGIQLDGSLAYNASAASSSNIIALNNVTNNKIGINILQGALNNSLLLNAVYNNAIANVIK